MGRLRGRTLSTLVRRTGRAARIDGYAAEADTDEPIPTFGTRSGVGVPVSVEGRVWGMLSVASTSDDPPPPDTEERLAVFTDLVATAIANAQSRAELETSRAESRRAAEEQAALRRVATLVARGVPAGEIFDAVARETRRILDVDASSLVRLETDGSLTVLAGESTRELAAGTGERLMPSEGTAVGAVLATGRPARVDGYAGPPGSLAERMSALGYRGSVGAPVVVNGRVWGVMVVGWTETGAAPEGIEERLGEFTELIATAIANAQARGELRAIADEQAALRRVATLVAAAPAPPVVFAAVAEEVGRLLHTRYAFVVRYDADGSSTIVAHWSASEAIASVGQRQPLDQPSLSKLVWETGRAARLDEDSYEGALAATLRQAGIRSSAGAPITVGGGLWGLIAVASARDEPLAAETEARLSDFTRLVATAIGNAQAQAELTASRARIIATADETRRRIERDLHDGAQQRLVSLGLQLQGARAALPAGLGEVAAELDGVAQGLTSTLEELREYARGIHPAILSESGLALALKAVARRSAVPVELDVRTTRRLPEPIEVGVYYVVSEALANVSKHAGASRATVDVEAADGCLCATVRDDGIGGAAFTPGSGLVGLKDRVEALGGQMSLESPPGAGTRVEVQVPVGDDGGER
jgi:signal transduction histidine kinase